MVSLLSISGRLKLSSGLLWALPAIGLFFLSGCATGKSAFRSGDYTEAARVSADRLSWSPKAGKAGEIFLMAYPLARQEWLLAADRAEQDLEDPFRWERVARAYEVLSDLANRASLTPFANHGAIVIDYFSEERKAAREAAAAAREAAGDAAFAMGDIWSAREAHGHYGVALGYAGSRATLLEKQEAARRAGTLWVGIDPISAEGHGLNPESLEAALMQRLSERPGQPFVRFVRAEELAERQAAFYVTVSLGEFSLERVDAEVARIPFRRIVGGEGRDREVSATVFRREKRFVAKNPVTLSVYRQGDGNRVYENTIEGRSVWAAQWDILEGDERALDERELHLSEPEDPEFRELASLSSNSVAQEAHETLVAFFYDK